MALTFRKSIGLRFFGPGQLEGESAKARQCALRAPKSPRGEWISPSIGVLLGEIDGPGR